MNKITKYVPVFLLALMMTVVIPGDAVAVDPEMQETDVAIVKEEYYNDDDPRQSGTSNEYAPGYHDLIVTAEENVVTFHNYVVLHDERIQATQYYVKFYIEVWEGEMGNEALIKSKYTGFLQYTPPRDYQSRQDITIEVDFSGGGITHEYHVGSGFEWYRVKSDGTLEDHPYRDTMGIEQAYVHEIIEIS